MSRWTEEFDKHPFQNTWADLKLRTEEITLDDETVETSLAEVARLRKAIAFLSEMIGGVDPELVPSSTWSNFASQATACLAEITSYNSNRNIGHIANANNHVDNLLAYVRPYMVLPSSAVAAVSRAASAYSKAAEDYVADVGIRAQKVIKDLSDFKINAESDISLIESSKQRIESLEIELFGQDRTSGLQKEIRELRAEIEIKNAELAAFYKEVFVGVNGVASTKQTIDAAKTDATKQQKEIEILLTGATKQLSELDQFHMTIFGKSNEDGTRAGGLDVELVNLKSKLISFEITQSEKYIALTKEIESLLPGATSAGLATAYKEMKDSFDDTIKRSGMLFYVSVGILVVASFFLAVETIGFWQIKFRDISTWDSVLKSMAFKFPFYAPIVWLAYYATKRRSEAQRLQQEYAHKESLAKSYNSYKKQIEELGVEKEKLLGELIRNTIVAISYNASSTLDGKHGDKMPTPVGN